ncbi:hypothetical protein FB466_1584 [Klugiella xanthotipulae]|uniref:Uncharacterized protein n=1 Tax=Klugiella xanthotipulae TaxID=244735 RepID=A0A543HY92_9MICO|nr:hypothetical protein FB466_1584 [Klugiella xanthotipulae]
MRSYLPTRIPLFHTAILRPHTHTKPTIPESRDLERNSDRNTQKKPSR